MIIILLFSIFTSFTIISPKSNIASAVDPFLQFESFVVLEIENSSVLDIPVHPLGGVKNINITIKYFNTIPQELKDNNIINKLFRGLIFGFDKFVFIAPVNLTFESDSIPSWCTVSIVPQNIIFNAFDEGSDLERKATLQVAVNKKSTALFPFTLNVKSYAASLNKHDKHITPPPDVILPVIITPGYVPLLSTDPGAAIKKTTPGESVNWNIRISNNGNGEALVKARIINPPDGWIVSVNPQIIIPSLAERESNEKILSLTALPPLNLGYFNENVKLEIELTPEFSSPGTGSFVNLTKGDSLYLTLVVKLRGFSLPGYEFIFIISGILICIIIRKYEIFKIR
ncbi:hypothetical protein ACFL1L_03325 [Thermoplasmatota archaeon]